MNNDRLTLDDLAKQSGFEFLAEWLGFLRNPDTTVIQLLEKKDELLDKAMSSPDKRKEPK